MENYEKEKRKRLIEKKGKKKRKKLRENYVCVHVLY